MAPAPSSRAVAEKGLWVACALIVALSLAVHARALTNGFVSLDDEPYVTGNPEVRAGLSWQGIRWAFTTTHEANWHPLTWISHMADVELFGLEPFGHHLTSVLLHAANALLVLLLFARMTGRLWPSAAVAALFAVHPLRVESVAWVAERKDVLCAFFGLLAMMAYARSVRAGRRGSSPAAVTLFAMSLLAKPMLVTFPFLLLLLDFWPLERMKAPDGSLSREPALWRRLVFEKWPFFLLSAVSSAVTLWAQKTGGATADNAIPLGARLGNALSSYLAYIKMTFAPFSLSVLYPHPGKAGGSAVFAAAILVAISLFAVFQARRRPFVAAGWLWFLGALVPVIGLVQVGWQARADRYTYLPSIGLFVVLVWGWRDIALRVGTGPRVLFAVSAAVVGVLSFLTWREIEYWKDSETLYARGLATTEKNHILHINLGIERVRHGAVSEGLDHFRQGVSIQPGYWYGQLTLGAALAGMERPAEAIPYLETALRLHPDSVEGRTALGGALAAQGRLPEAVSQLQQAIALNPGAVRAHHALGKTLDLQGRPKEALEEYRKVVRLDPSNADAQDRLAQGLLSEGKLTEALAQLDEALRDAPDSVPLHLTHARALVAAGRRTEAKNELRVTLRLSPGLTAAATLLVAMLATSPDTSAAEAEEALEIARKLAQQGGGKDPNMLDLLAAAQAQVGRYAEAVQTAELAMRLADAAGQKKTSQLIAGRLAFYKARRPYRSAGQ